MQAFDQHLNMILSDAEEVVTTLELDEETYEEIYRVIEYFSDHVTTHGLMCVNVLHCYV